MNQYRKMPVVIEAVQWDGAILGEYGADEIEAWSNGAVKCLLTESHPIEATVLCVATLEGTMQAKVGDWIIKGVNGEFYPCKDEIFQKTYERVDG
jgi:hypothetical protein